MSLVLLRDRSPVGAWILDSRLRVGASDSYVHAFRLGSCPNLGAQTPPIIRPVILLDRYARACTRSSPILASACSASETNWRTVSRV